MSSFFLLLGSGGEIDHRFLFLFIESLF